jgi:hypothetical protein
MFARRAVALGEGVEVEVAVEEVEAEAEGEAEAEAGEKKDQYRKLREQNEVTERGGLGAHRGRGLCCSGAGKAFWWPRSWTFGLGRRAGRQVGQATQARQAWEVGLLELGCSQEQARSCSTGVGKVPSQTPTPRPSSKPASEHPIPSPRASLDSRKRARRGGSREIGAYHLYFAAAGKAQSDRPVARPRKRDVLLQEQNEGVQRRGEQRREEQRREEQRRAERKSGCTGIQGYSLLSAALLWQLCRPSLRAPACLPASLLCIRSFDNLTACISGAEAPCQRLSVLCSSRTFHPFLQSIPGFGLEMQLNFVIIAEAAGLLQTLGAAELCPTAELAERDP